MTTGCTVSENVPQVLTYVAEITQPHLRGSLSATSSMCVILGVFTQFVFGTLMNWRTVALVNISFTVSCRLPFFYNYFEMTNEQATT